MKLRKNVLAAMLASMLALTGAACSGDDDAGGGATDTGTDAGGAGATETTS